MVGGRAAAIYSQAVNGQPLAADARNEDYPGSKPFVVIPDKTGAASYRAVLADEDRDGVPVADDQSLDRDDSSVAGVTLRIMKVVKGKWTMLANVKREDSKTVYIPAVNRQGKDHDVNTAADNDGN